MATFKQLENGDLELSIDNNDCEAIIEMREEKSMADGDIFLDIFEKQFCNGYAMVLPENIGALTDGILISDTIIDEETTKEETDSAKIWHNPNYQIESEIDVLINYGKIIFELA